MITMLNEKGVRIMKRAKVLAVVVGSFAMLGLSLSPVPALAIPILEFNVVQGSGSVTYGGGADDLNGTGLSVNSVKGLGTGAHAGGSVTCVSCTLIFDTGSRIAGWTWGSVGPDSISIKGGVDLNGDGDALDPADIPVGTTLLTGGFGSAFVTALDLHDFKLVGASFLDTKNGKLTTYYGLPGGPYDGSLGLFFHAPGLIVGSPITSTSISSGTVSNTPLPVPEASSLLLLGSGLLSLAFWGRKKFKDVN